MKNVLNKTLSIKFLTYALLGVLVLSLVLLLRLGLFSAPWYDDYGYAKYTKSFQEAYGPGIYNAIRGAMYQTKESWWAWQGTFSSIFLMALCPLVLGETMYWIGPWLLILMLTISAVTLGHVVCKRIFGMSKDASFCAGLSLAILMVWRVYSACQGFYWYNAGVHYVGMHSLMMFFIATLICLCEKKSWVSDVLKILLSMLLALACSGANYVTALQGMLAMAVIIFYAFFVRKIKPFLFLPAFAVYIIGFRYNVIAPGNSVRSSYFVGSSMSAVEAVLQSFVKALECLWNFTGLFTIAFAIMLAPVVWKGLNGSELKFRLPGVFVALSFCMYATSFTPTLYAIGNSNIDRVLNAAKLTYQLMLFLSEIYAVGWVKSRFFKDKEEINLAWIYAVCVLALSIAFTVSPAERFSYTPYGAYYYVHSGEAANLHNVYLSRVEEINKQGPDVRFGANIFLPPYLCVEDLSENPDHEANRFMAQWYGKNSIAVVRDYK